jgi:hypothetical protein
MRRIRVQTSRMFYCSVPQTYFPRYSPSPSYSNSYSYQSTQYHGTTQSRAQVLTLVTNSLKLDLMMVMVMMMMMMMVMVVMMMMMMMMMMMVIMMMMMMMVVMMVMMMMMMMSMGVCCLLQNTCAVGLQPSSSGMLGGGVYTTTDYNKAARYLSWLLQDHKMCAHDCKVDQLWHSAYLPECIAWGVGYARRGRLHGSGLDKGPKGTAIGRFEITGCLLMISGPSLVIAGHMLAVNVLTHIGAGRSGVLASLLSLPLHRTLSPSPIGFLCLMPGTQVRRRGAPPCGPVGGFGCGVDRARSGGLGEAHPWG